MRTVVKGKTDPVWFIEEVLGVRMFPMQQQIVKTFYQSRYNRDLEQIKKLIVVAGMRGGKTAVASMIMGYELFDVITIDNPSHHYGLMKNQPIFLTAVATSEKLASDGVFQNMVNMIEGSEWLSTWGDLRIKSERIDCDKKFVHAQVLGSWVNTAVGRSNRCVVFDELDLFENTTGKRGAWEIWSRLRKSTDTFGLDGHVVAISSPQSPTGIMMSLYRSAQQGEPNTLSYLLPTWKMNPNLPEKQLRDEYKYDMATFWRDFACQPEAAGGLQFPEGIILTPMTNVLKTPSYRDKIALSRCLAIDPAVTNDSFGLACGYMSPLTGGIVVDGVTKFSKEEGNAYIIPSEVKAFIDEAIPRLNVNHFVFDAWIFPDLVEHVQVKYGIVAEKHVVDKETYDLWRGLHRGDGEIPLSVVEDDDLRREAENLIAIKASKPRVDHPFGGSKDVSDCVANVIWYLKTQDTSMMTLNFAIVKAY